MENVTEFTISSMLIAETVGHVDLRAPNETKKIISDKNIYCSRECCFEHKTKQSNYK